MIPFSVDFRNDEIRTRKILKSQISVDSVSD